MKVSDLVVLLVEPSEIQSRIITRHLEEVGVSRHQWASSGRAALEVLAANDLHLVISAMHLPDMTCPELIQEIDALGRPDYPALLLASSETKAAYLEPIRQAGPAAMLPKPFSVDDLREALRLVLDVLEPGRLHLPDQDTEELRVLLVDDSTPTRRFLRKLLNDMGLEQVTEADDGATAVPLLQDNFFDLVLTDYNMPRMSGLDLVRYIRTESAQASVPVIMISSETDPARIQAVKDQGVSAICPKPFEAKILKNLIQELLGEA